jgi:hypothetical protein
MRLPLFVFLRAWRGNRMAPEAIRHSGILSYQWAQENNRRPWLFTWEAAKGSDAIRDICARVFRDRAPVRLQDVAAVSARIARTIYGPTQLSLFLKRNADYKSGCFVQDDETQRLYYDGQTQWFCIRVIPINPAPVLPCRWCGIPTTYSDKWRRNYDRSIRCNAPDCRRMDYLEHTPQSRGGIDLTPRQRRSLDGEARKTQKMINYLLLVAKEKRIGH